MCILGTLLTCDLVGVRTWRVGRPRSRPSPPLWTAFGRVVDGPIVSPNETRVFCQRHGEAEVRHAGPGGGSSDGGRVPTSIFPGLRAEEPSGFLEYLALESASPLPNLVRPGPLRSRHSDGGRGVERRTREQVLERVERCVAERVVQIQVSRHPVYSAVERGGGGRGVAVGSGGQGCPPGACVSALVCRCTGHAVACGWAFGLRRPKPKMDQTGITGGERRWGHQ